MTSSCHLTNLPSELLYQILIKCEPSDLGSLSRVNRSLHDYIKDAAQLWKEVYMNRWDEYNTNIQDHIVNLQCPSTSSVTIVNPEQRSSTNRSIKIPFNHAKQVQRRTWVEKRLRTLQDRPIDLYANYNETLRALIAIARSRSLRKGSQSQESNTKNEIDDLGLSAEYLTTLLTVPERIEVFRKVVYPRSDIKLIRQWQLKNLTQQREKLKGILKREEKRARSASSGSASITKKSKRTHSIQQQEDLEGSNSIAASTSLLSPPKRRSARVQLHAYPTELHHLLYDKGGNDLITLDDGTGLANLEALELVDEQLAAQLHVLHGIHPGFRPSNEKRSNNRTTSRADGAESESDDPDFSDHGSIPEEEEFEEDVEVEEEEEDPDEMHNNIFRFFINQMDINRRPREPALGSNLGHQGNLQLRARAREIVYDTARYGVENSFGPLRAWRERFVQIDGPRIRSAQDWEDEEDEEWQGNWILDPRDLEENFEVISEGEHESDGQASSEEDEGEGALAAEEDDEEADPDFVGHQIDHPDDEEEEEDDDDDDDDETEALFGIRALAISMSRGCLPWAEAAQLSGKMNRIRGQSSSSSSNHENTNGEARFANVWRMEKRVDWVILESIMIVMYCNIRHAVLNHAWGKAFRLPGSQVSLVGRDRFARRIYLDNEQSRNSYNPDEAWRNVLGLPVGWNHTRGTLDERTIPDHSDKKQKPYDWAHVESTWIGTYAFLDWTKWASFNARDPISRGLPDPRLNHHTEAPEIGPFPYGHNQGSPSLEGEREALGDCLQLRLELLPIEEQRPFNEREQFDTRFEGYDDMLTTDDGEETSFNDNLTSCQEFKGRNHYPLLRFRGHTRTYIDEGEPIPRGECYGSVRPIYETEDDDPTLTKKRPNRRKDLTEGNRAIVALHWEITHRYDGEDAWSLSGVQAGPPGTQAPIYGIWGSAQRQDNMSPCGPFAYYRVDDRRWKDLDEQRTSQM
jgi:F-box-like